MEIFATTMNHTTDISGFMNGMQSPIEEKRAQVTEEEAKSSEAKAKQEPKHLEKQAESQKEASEEVDRNTAGSSYRQRQVHIVAQPKRYQAVVYLYAVTQHNGSQNASYLPTTSLGEVRDHE